MYRSKIKVNLTDIVDIETKEDPRHMSREGLQEIITENLADKISLYDHDDLKGTIDSTNILETKTDATEVPMNPTDKNGCPIKCGDNIFVDPPSSTDNWNCEFEGTAESFRHGYVVVVDMAGDYWDIEPEKLTVI